MLDHICEKFARERGIDLEREHNYKGGVQGGIEISYLRLIPPEEALIIGKTPECEVSTSRWSVRHELLILLKITQGFLPDYLAMLSRSEDEFNGDVLAKFEPYLAKQSRATECAKEVFLGRSSDNLMALVNCLFPPPYAPRR